MSLDNIRLVVWCGAKTLRNISSNDSCPGVTFHQTVPLFPINRQPSVIYSEYLIRVLLGFMFLFTVKEANRVYLILFQRGKQALILKVDECGDWFFLFWAKHVQQYWIGIAEQLRRDAGNFHLNCLPSCFSAFYTFIYPTLKE